MAPPTMPELDLEGRRVLIRADFDVPITPARGIDDPTRIRQALPSIELALSRGARVILASHLGRPKGEPDPQLSLEPVGAFLADRLGQEVVLTDEPAGDGVRKVVADLRPGGVVLLENLRFAAGELGNEERFARALAGYADVYINDAFCVSHLPHASVVGVPRHVSERALGLRCKEERDAFARLLGEVPRPFFAVLGGDRFAARIPLLETLLDRVDGFLFGGAIANTFLRARGPKLGRSLLEDDRLPWSRSFLDRARNRDVAVHLPRDLLVAAGIRAPSGRPVGIQSVPDDLAALDIGPETQAAYAETLSRARTVYWNGSLGVAEVPPFAGGTLAIATALGNTLGITAIVAGRTTATALRRAKLTDRLTHVSEAGAAAAEFQRGHGLVGLAALQG